MIILYHYYNRLSSTSNLRKALSRLIEGAFPHRMNIYRIDIVDLSDPKPKGYVKYNQSGGPI